MAQSPEQQRAAFDAAIRNAPARQVNVGSTSPIDRVVADAQRARGVTVQPVHEQARAQVVTANPGANAPSFRPVPTRSPFTPRTDIPVPPIPRAGGSKR
jgi:hypothetical protein